MEKHRIMGGKVHVYRRPNSQLWQCSTYLAGRNHRVSTKEDSLARAKEFAEDWYLELRGKSKRGELKVEKTFNDAADQFTKEYEVLTRGERNEKYVQDHQSRLRNHLRPFFGKLGLSEVTTAKVQEYRLERQRALDDGEAERKIPSRSTMHHEVVTLRQVLKTAVRHGWLDRLPDLSLPYRTSNKVTHRAWFSPEEYRALYQATRMNVRKAKGLAWQWDAEQMHDYVLLLANSGIRPDEANGLQFRDVRIVEDEDTKERILEIEVRGKRGIGFCKSTSNAVRPFERLRDRPRPLGEGILEDGSRKVKKVVPQPTDLVFPVNHKRQFNRILEELGLKLDRDGNRRTAYSLRHTYICMRLMEGADIYQIAKNCRTSVEMIENYYASHIRTHLDAAAINVKRKRNTGGSADGLSKKEPTRVGSVLVSPHNGEDSNSD